MNSPTKSPKTFLDHLDSLKKNCRDFSPLSSLDYLSAAQMAAQQSKFPSACQECGAMQVELVHSTRIYKSYVPDWPYLWYCPDCDSYVQCMNGTLVPKGTLANPATRKARQFCVRLVSQIERDLKPTGFTMDHLRAYFNKNFPNVSRSVVNMQHREIEGLIREYRKMAAQWKVAPWELEDINYE